MRIVQVQIPDSLHKSLYDLASRDGISVDQFISTAIAEKLSALMTENYLKERAKRGISVLNARLNKDSWLSGCVCKSNRYAIAHPCYSEFFHIVSRRSLPEATEF
jgi:hypothetical protein